MTNKKRIFALASSVFILISCFALAVVPASAAVSFNESYYSTVQDPVSGSHYSQGNLPSGYDYWYQLFSAYYDPSSSSPVYYFEVRNTEQGGNRYAPNFNYWPLAYSADQSGYGIVNVDYYFYLPWNNGNGWDFQLRAAQTGALIFDSSTARFYQDINYPSRGYYSFTLDRNILGLSTGWYIYSMYLPPYPEYTSPSSIVSINYVLSDTSNVVGFREVVVPNVSGIYDLALPSIPDYYFSGGFNGAPSGYYRFTNGINGNVTITIPVYSIRDAIENAYNNGYDLGVNEGYSTGYDLGYDQGYDEGYELGFEQGEEYGRTQAESGVIENPLLWLSEPVVAFLNIEVYPGLHLGVLFLVAIAGSLVILFLKLFAGG